MYREIVCIKQFRIFSVGVGYIYLDNMYIFRDDGIFYCIYDLKNNIVGYLNIGQINFNFIDVEEWENSLREVEEIFNFYMDYNLLEIK